MMTEPNETSEASEIQTEVADAGGCRRRLSVTFTAAQVEDEIGDTVRRYARAVRIAGFRRGKTPPAIVRRRFTKEIEEEVREHLVRHGLSAGLERHNLLPLHNPVIEGGDAKEGEPYHFTALFEVRPKIVLGEYRNLAVSMPEPAITEEEIARALDSVREKLARFVPVEPRAIVRGDFVLVDLQGKYEDGKGKDFKHENVMIEVGSESNLQEFDDALAGMSGGETKSFSVGYPPDFDAEHLAGRRLLYTLTVKEIKIKELPPIDDELPKDLGKEGTLVDLREEIRASLVESRRREAERQARESLLRQLIESHPVEVPEVMVEDQLNLQVEEIVRGMIVRGIHPSKTDIDWNQVREKELPLARQRVLGTLILDEIAARESIEVTENEIEHRILEQARKMGERSGEVRKRLAEKAARQALKNQMVREKSLDFVLKNAKISL